MSVPGAQAVAEAPRADVRQGYYGRPLLKPPVWTWEVPIYMFVGGAAGAASVLGAAARLSGADPGLVRRAHWIAGAGGLVSPVLLVKDLGRPARFLNMLRVMKVQSPMSVGTWTLVAFSSGAAAAAFADLVAERYGPRLPVRMLGALGDALAAPTGPLMASYTGVLLGATAVPVWAASARALPVEFAAGALGSAVGLLELLGRRERGLARLGVAAALVESAVGLRIELDRSPVRAPLREGRTGSWVRLAGVLSGPLPLALRVLGRRRAAALASVAGALAVRHAWVQAGRASARDPGPALELEGRDGESRPLLPSLSPSRVLARIRPGRRIPAASRRAS